MGSGDWSVGSWGSGNWSVGSWGNNLSDDWGSNDGFSDQRGGGVGGYGNFFFRCGNSKILENYKKNLDKNK
jgi:hypothetical protein